MTAELRNIFKKRTTPLSPPAITLNAQSATSATTVRWTLAAAVVGAVADP